VTSSEQPLAHARAGQGFTVFTWNGKPIAFARQTSHQSPQPVAAPSAIHPLDSAYPVEILTPLAAGPGQIQLELYELYGQQVWDNRRLRWPSSARGRHRHRRGLPSRRQHGRSRSPWSSTSSRRSSAARPCSPYTFEYHNCVITDIGDGETIEVGTMEVLKTITVMYTHMTRGGRNIFSGGSQVSLPGDVRNSHRRQLLSQRPARGKEGIHESSRP
jgi:hypothetical protein